MIKEATENTRDGISVGGHIVSALKYAADKAVVASTQKELQNLMDNLNKITKKYGSMLKRPKWCVYRAQETTSNKILVEG